MKKWVQSNCIPPSPLCPWVWKPVMGILMELAMKRMREEAMKITSLLTSQTQAEIETITITTLHAFKKKQNTDQNTAWLILMMEKLLLKEREKKHWILFILKGACHRQGILLNRMYSLWQCMYGILIVMNSFVQRYWMYHSIGRWGFQLVGAHTHTSIGLSMLDGGGMEGGGEGCDCKGDGGPG